MKKEEIYLRKAKLDDITKIISLVREGFPYIIENTIYGCSGIANYIEDNLNNSDYAYIVVIYKDEVSGMFEYRYIEDTIFLNYVILGDKLKGKGLACNIFELSISQLSVLHSKIKLDVFTTNNVAINWYNKMGFLPIDMLIWNEVKVKQIFSPKMNFKIINNKHYKNKLQRYGFSMLEFKNNWRSYSLGIMGEKWLRITDKSILNDENAIMFITMEFPEKKIFSITDINVETNSNLILKQIINSQRMEKLKL